MGDCVYVIREKADFNLMSEEEVKQHKKRQKQEINKKYYHKKKQNELYFQDTYDLMLETINKCDDNCSEEEIDLFLECLKICEEELMINTD